MIDLSRAYRHAAAEHGLTQRQVALSAKMSLRTVSRIATGSVDPSLSSLERIAAACGVSLSRLIRWGEGED